MLTPEQAYQKQEENRKRKKYFDNRKEALRIFFKALDLNSKASKAIVQAVRQDNTLESIALDLEFRPEKAILDRANDMLFKKNWRIVETALGHGKYLYKLRPIVKEDRPNIPVTVEKEILGV